MGEIVNRLELLSRQLFDSAFKFDHNASATSVIGEIFNILKTHKNLKEFNLNLQEIMRISTTFASMGKLLYTDVELFTIDEQSKQNCENIKIIDYFNLIEKKNYHSCCKDGETYVCSYHTEDLFTHLHLTCLQLIPNLIGL